MRVKLKTKFGQFWDRRLRWGITAGEVKDLPEPLSQDTLTYQKLRMGGFEIVKDDVGRAVPDVWDAPVMEVTDISSVRPDATPPVGRAVPDDSNTPNVEDEGITAATDRPTKPGTTAIPCAPVAPASVPEYSETIESRTITEPEAENRPAETLIPLDPKPAPKKRGRPKKTK